MTVAFTLTERADQTMRLPILQLSCRLLLQSITSPRSFNTPYSSDLASCDFWLFPKLKSPLKRRRFVNATVTQYTNSVNGVSLPTDWPHGRMTVHGCTVRFPLTRCQVTSRPRDRFTRYSEWLDNFRTALLSITHEFFKSIYKSKIMYSEITIQR